MKKINLSDLQPKNYYEIADNSVVACMICGKDVEKIEKKFNENAEKFMNHDPKFIKWFNANYIQIDTDGNVYFADEEVAEGHESQGCFPVGCSCMKKYRSLRIAQG